MKKKERSKKDNDCLKVSPWSIFVEIYKPIFTDMFPNESKMEIYKHLVNKWEQFDDSDKKAYVDKANFKNRAVVRLNNIAHKKNKPDRKTVSPYSLFVAEKHQVLKNQQPEMSLIERTKLISQMWKGLTLDEKRPYMNMAKRKTRLMQKQSSGSENEDDFDGNEKD
ncbi:HMG box family protein [Tritrichomonas foetus]|uniref:HMG box family protein n=1 Tax=Tritrichomonas foetus TaxID=1144522 RepID=A0A1J4L1A1_9EUKA|nr:HMG box family protein [Tritrichomonas foetus]|eukprot:OHT17295.1 HMG box family protein [Tritrichomonas foetus]